jgi:hypothetical protein
MGSPELIIEVTAALDFVGGCKAGVEQPLCSKIPPPEINSAITSISDI